MKVFSSIMYCITFIAAGVFFGGLYEKYNISYRSALIVFIALSAILVFSLIFDHFLYKKIFKEQENDTPEIPNNTSNGRELKKKVS